MKTVKTSGKTRQEAARKTLMDSNAAKVSGRPVENRSKVFVVLGAVMIALGIWIFAKHSLYPIVQWRAAQGWVETPCLVVKSDVTRGDEDSTIRIEYQYTWEDLAYSGHLSERTSVLYLYDTGYEQKLLADHAASRESVCYVNPNHPERSLLTRQFSPGYLTGAWGLFLFWFGWMAIDRGRRRRPVSAGGRVELESVDPKTRGWWLGGLGAAIFGNALVVLFGGGLYQLNTPDMNPVEFWVITGLVVLFFVAPVILLDVRLFKQILAARNPHLALHLVPEEIRAGASADLDWMLTGAVGRIRRFRIWLEGRDEVERGHEETRWETAEVFKEISIFDTEQPNAMRRGQAKISVPKSSKCTSTESRTRTRWFLRAHGEIDKWPDIDEYYPVTVRPAHE